MRDVSDKPPRKGVVRQPKSRHPHKPRGLEAVLGKNASVATSVNIQSLQSPLDFSAPTLAAERRVSSLRFPIVHETRRLRGSSPFHVHRYLPSCDP